MRTGIGFFGGDDAPLTLSFLSSATSTSSTIAWPGSLLAGDEAYLFDFARNTTGDPTEVIPSGFTQIPSGAAGQLLRLTISKKILTGSESGNITGQNGTSGNNKTLVIVRGSRAIAGSTESTATYDLNINNPSSQVIAGSGGVAPLIEFGIACSSASTALFSTASPAFDAEISNARLRVGYKLYDSAPADHTIDMHDQGINILCGFYSQLS